MIIDNKQIEVLILFLQEYLNGVPNIHDLRILSKALKIFLAGKIFTLREITLEIGKKYSVLIPVVTLEKILEIEA